MTPDAESDPAYEVILLDQADADMEAAYNFGLVDFPGLYAHPFARSARGGGAWLVVENDAGNG